MSRSSLIQEWGPEVILRCPCSDHRAHHMDGRTPRCPQCRGETVILYGMNWEDIESRYKR